MEYFYLDPKAMELPFEIQHGQINLCPPEKFCYLVWQLFEVKNLDLLCTIW